MIGPVKVTALTPAKTKLEERTQILVVLDKHSGVHHENEE